MKEYEKLKTLETFGFLLEILAFISTGYYLAKWRLLAATITLVIGLGLAFYVGEIIKKTGVIEKKHGAN